MIYSIINIEFMNNNKNKDYWNNLNINYSKMWEGRAQQEMSKREMSFINYFLEKSSPKKILDIGVGTGRILENYIRNSPPNSEIYGVDISDKMVKICQDKFKNEKGIRAIKVCDVSQKQISFDDDFDFITAIRVLKYNKNWPEILQKIYYQLNKNGIFIFTMLNNNSINRFFKSGIPIYRTTKKELKSIFKKIGYDILEIRSFTKVPDFFYKFSNNLLYVKLLILAEGLLEKILGNTFLGRILFVAVKKGKNNMTI